MADEVSQPNGEKRGLSPSLSDALAALTKADLAELEKLGYVKTETAPASELPIAFATPEVIPAPKIEVVNVAGAHIAGSPPKEIVVEATPVIDAPSPDPVVEKPKPQLDPPATDPQTPGAKPQPPVVEAPAAPAATPTTPPEPPPAPAKTKRVDPHALPAHMALLRPQYFFWSIEAILKTGYEWVDEETGKKETRYWPLDGLLLGRAGEGSSSLMILTYRKIIASNYAGKLVEAPAGSRVIFAANQHTCELFRVLKDASARGGKPHVWIGPTGFETLCDGKQEMCFQLAVEPDPSNAAGYKLITDESAIGQATSGEKVAA